MSDLKAVVDRNIARIRENVSAACRRAGRQAGDVRIVAVTKGLPADAVIAARTAGLADIGENRVTEALAKAPRCGPGLAWHLIGRLQTNKARKAAAFFDCVHSLDRTALVDVLQSEAERADRRIRCFLQINVSGELSKSGVPPREAEGLLRQVLSSDRLEPVGLMTMAPLSVSPEEARPIFRDLRALRDALSGSVSGASSLTGLSMGMSQDYLVAVEEGATHVRIGTALFSPTH
jgi:pyridoxal phosphate enzyme (YggS family)